MDNDTIVNQIIKMTDQAQTMEELYQTLDLIVFAIGGMVCHFDQEDRTRIIVSLTETMGLGLMNTSKSLGESCDLEIVTGGGVM